MPSLPLSHGPFCRQRFGLLQDILYGRILKIGRIAIFAKNPLHKHPHAGAGRIPVHPVHGHVALDAGHQFMRDDPQRGLAHDLARAFVLGQRVVEGDFLVAEAAFLAALPVPPGCPWQAGSVLRAPAPS